MYVGTLGPASHACFAIPAETWQESGSCFFYCLISHTRAGARQDPLAPAFPWGSAQPRQRPRVPGARSVPDSEEHSSSPGRGELERTALGEGCHLGRRTFELEGNRVRAPVPTSRLGQQRIRLCSCWCLNLVLRLFVAKALTNSVKPTSISSLIKLHFSVK